MTNPFKEFFGGGSEAPEVDKEKELRELREWEAQVRAGMGMERHPDDVTKLEEIEEKIKKLENAE